MAPLGRSTPSRWSEGDGPRLGAFAQLLFGISGAGTYTRFSDEIKALASRYPQMPESASVMP
ncbi:hypothetical protein MBEBAB_2103 [Brevundimonas abyssalis TAR-001]|uniref:Uncharacterized protein n=1 Tax=Brevundimonas abyssalis TAR-001 TaxID=1391729 RepID=A0A8E0NCH5_9CAUL|nr:hypothetical protein MBEBAB_2103 [Brevundimonas abyssalis TAR-001]